MRKILLIARSNIRKAKGQSVAIIILTLIAALMLNLWLMLALDYKANFNRYHDKFHAEHVTLAVDGNTDKFQEFLSEIIENDSNTAEYRLDNCMHMTGSFAYNGGERNSWFVFLKKQAALTRSIGKIEIVEEGTFTSGVYLPMLYKTDDIAVGKPIELSIGSHTETFTVCGFFNSIMLGSHNCGMTEVVLTEDLYTELENDGYAPQATLCSIRLTDRSESLNYEALLKSAVSERYPNIVMVSNSYNLVSQSRYISQMICSGILCAMAFFILLIVLVVIVSNIVNYIQVNMKNLGALKAQGYTLRQLICSLLLQFLGLASVAAVAGIGFSYLLFPAVNAMMIAQTGIPYNMRFLPLPLIISLIILVGAVSLAVCGASNRIKRIEPIVALRSGIQTHNFRSNHVPLEKTNAPLNLALALKNTLSGLKHNITIAVTMLVLSLIVVFSGVMFKNVIMDITPFSNFIMGEIADSIISVQVEAEEDFLHEANADNRVEKLYLYTSLNVSHVGGAELQAMLCDDFSKVNNQNTVFEGRFPKYDISIGDTIIFEDTSSGTCLECLVLNLYMYPSFNELYAHHDKISIGYVESEVANPADMLMYYSEEKISKYGVVGIEIRVV